MNINKRKIHIKENLIIFNVMIFIEFESKIIIFSTKKLLNHHIFFHRYDKMCFENSNLNLSNQLNFASLISFCFN